MTVGKEQTQSMTVRLCSCSAPGGAQVRPRSGLATGQDPVSGRALQARAAVSSAESLGIAGSPSQSLRQGAPQLVTLSYSVFAANRWHHERPGDGSLSSHFIHEKMETRDGEGVLAGLLDSLGEKATELGPSSGAHSPERLTAKTREPGVDPERENAPDPARRGIRL